ncbi:MAG: D-alanyl-D-alanine carboxypeptidase/D-alanyl-D-alanine-endopeptidase [Gemmatimonas sp.]
MISRSSPFDRRIRDVGLLVLAVAGCRTATPSGTRSAPSERRSEPVAPLMMPAAVASAPMRDRDRVRELADSAINAPMWANAHWGVIIVDAISGDTLFSHNADKLFMPASNQKLMTGAIAMQHLGPAYVWRTPVLLRGRQRGADWEGDLLLAGSGDPSFSDTLRSGDAASAFDPIVAALRARGITRITGTVRAHGDAFTGPTTGFGWEIDDLDASYGAPVDELMFNEGELRLKVRAGASPGDAVIVSERLSGYPRVLNLGVTRGDVGINPAAGARGGTADGDRLRAAYDSIGDRMVLSGSLATGDSASFTVSYRHPADAVFAEVAARLRANGISVRGDSLLALPAPALDTVTVLESPPLSVVLPRMQKPSQNQIAELLFRTSGLRVSGSGSADSARAVGTRTLAAWGIRNEDVAYRDGSGLSRHDYVTPRALLRTLDAMRRAPWFDAYRNALPLAGVDGTLRSRMRGTAAAENARAKTGTVDKARSLSGYVTSADGRLVMFSMLANNFTVPTREVERVQDLLVVALANAHLADSVSNPTR